MTTSENLLICCLYLLILTTRLWLFLTKDFGSWTLFSMLLSKVNVTTMCETVQRNLEIWTILDLDRTIQIGRYPKIDIIKKHQSFDMCYEVNDLVKE